MLALLGVMLWFDAFFLSLFEIKRRYGAHGG